MTLTAGEQCGGYEILKAIGAGGMGEVYLGTDSKLGRKVAIKVLSQAFAGDPQWLVRFEREARVMASLNHPGIAAIYGLEQCDSVPFLVLEYVPGETLRTPLPLDQALPIATQICEAIEAAHERGIIHRDLKPANIKVTPEGKVKVLDFGLAKLFDQEQTGGDPSQSPTVTVATGAGVMLGSPAYMSPEQARGQPVDSRTDVWAFGCVLYEMLVGKAAFGGQHMADTLAAIVTREPDWSVLPADTPESVRRLLRRCLRKQRAERLQHIGDARLELQETTASGPLPPTRTPVAPWVVSALFAAGMLAVSLVRFHETTSEPQALKLALLPPEKTRFNEIAVSPDGQRVAFTAIDQEGKRQLWLRPLESLTAQALRGTEGASYPFWSPNGRWIAFFAEDKLKKVEISGGPPQIIANAPIGGGGAWSGDGMIVFGSPRKPLVRVPASGGEPKDVTELDPSRREISHWWPVFLPDNRRFLYFIEGGPEHQGTYVGSLDSKEKTRLLASTSSALFGMDHLLFLRERTLLAQRFDASKLELSGEAIPIAEPVGVDDGIGRARVSVSMSGVLVYNADTHMNRRLLWLDRSGNALDTVDKQGSYVTTGLSPDGRRVAANRTDPRTGNMDIWLFDLVRADSTRFTFHPTTDGFPVWSPDGLRIAFASSREGAVNLYQKDSSGAGQEQLLLRTDANKWPTSWSPDGRRLLYSENGRNTRSDLWILALDTRQPTMWLGTEFDERNGQFSPDGKWVAYDSDESGRYEVYVQPFSPNGTAGVGRWLISTGGGERPRWSGGGGELFYFGVDRRLMSVEVTRAHGRFTAGIPKALFPMTSPGFGSNTYAVAADGKRFLIITEGHQAVSQPATVVTHWTAGFRR